MLNSPINLVFQNSGLIKQTFREFLTAPTKYCDFYSE